MENIEQYRDALMQIGLELGEVSYVPYYECGVQAGAPTDYGSTPSGWMQVPSCLLGDGCVYTVLVHGESMVDFDIKEGDKLLVHHQQTAQSGDIVVAMINGACTVKTYFEDEERVWLIPGNPNFAPIELNEDDDNRLVGVVKEIIHTSPRTSYRECVNILRNYKKDLKKPIRRDDIARALKAAVEVLQERNLSGSRPWFAVYRTFIDRGIIENGDYTTFISLLEDVMGGEAPNINVKDMRANIDVMSFASPVSLWNCDNAPVKGKRFYDYLEVANVTNKALLDR